MESVCTANIFAFFSISAGIFKSFAGLFDDTAAVLALLETAGNADETADETGMAEETLIVMLEDAGTADDLTGASAVVSFVPLQEVKIKQTVRNIAGIAIYLNCILPTPFIMATERKFCSE